MENALRPGTAVLPEHEGSNRGELLGPAAVVAAGCTIYLAIALLIGRFAVTDEVSFKAAGRQWAVGAGYRAPELDGLLHGVSPPVTEVFCLYQPMYPFSYGIWTRLVGFGARQCVLFDAWIHVLLTSVTFALAWRGLSSLGHLRPWLAACVAIAILPIGTAGRPDELAMSFGLLSLFLLLAPRPGAIHAVLAGLALGFCLGTSSGAAISFGFIAFTLLLFQTRDGLAQTLRRCMLMAAGGIVGASIIVGPLLAAHPGGLQQYVAHSRLTFNTGTIARTWSAARPHGTKYYTFLLGTLASGLLAATLIGTREGWRLWGRYAAGTFLCLLFYGKFLPLKDRYTWFIGPWILLAALHVTFLLAATPGKRRRASLPIALLATAHLSFAVYFVKESIVIGTLPAAQKLEAASERLRAIIPAHATVLAQDLWWFIADRNPTYDSNFSQPPEGAVDYVALTGNGSGVPGRPTPLDPRHWDSSFTDMMVEVANDLPTRPTYFLGVRITNSAYGFGAVVYRVDQTVRVTK